MCRTVDVKPFCLALATSLLGDAIARLEREADLAIVVKDEDRARLVNEIAVEVLPDVEIAYAIAQSYMEINRGKTIWAIKHVRQVMGWGLKQAKDLVDLAVPFDHEYRKLPEPDPTIALLRERIAELENKLATHEFVRRNTAPTFDVFINRNIDERGTPRATFRNLRDAQLFASGYDIAYGGKIEIFDSRGAQYAFEV